MNINFYEKIKPIKVHNPNYETHQISLPFRMLICTASGGGKTNFLLNLIFQMSNTFHKIIIITKEEERLYCHLLDRLKDGVEIHYGGNVPEFERMPKGENGLVVFDDMVLTKNNKIGEMFIRGRKLGYSSIYITQSFFATNKLIRQNVNYISLGRGMIKRDLRLVLSEFSINLSIDQLEDLYNTITKVPMQFMLIDSQKRNIRQNFDIIYEF